MNRIAFAIVMLFALLFAGCAGIGPPQGQGPVACTMEAKICPDGSAVGRTGPNCEFAPCPGEEGGQTGGNAQEDFLLSHKWKLLKIDNETLENSPVEIRFDKEKGMFSGNAGCNNMGGAYTLDGDQLSFGQTAITLMYCEDTMDLEGKVLEKINGGPYKWELAEQALNFYKGEELVMIWGVQAE